KYLKQDAVRDLRTLSDCFRQFSEENVGSFCNFMVKAKEGKPAPRTKPGAKPNSVNGAKVGDMVQQIRHFLDNRDRYDVAGVRQLAAQLKNLKNSEIEAVGEQIRCPVKDTKGAMIHRIENWLMGIKLS